MEPEDEDEKELLARLANTPVYVICHSCGHEGFDIFEGETQECRVCTSCDVTVEAA